jgi:predicted phosphodiesterase
LYDIHASAPAPSAVLEDVERDRVDLVVIGGDVVPGPLPVEAIELPPTPRARAAFLRGNADRMVRRRSTHLP